MELIPAHDELRSMVESTAHDLRVTRTFAIRLCVEHDATRLLGAEKAHAELVRAREANRALLERYCATLEAVQAVLEPLAHGRAVDVEAVWALIRATEPEDGQ